MIIRQRVKHISTENANLNPQINTLRKGYFFQPAGCQQTASMTFAHQTFQLSGGDLDQTLNKKPAAGSPPRRQPDGLPGFVGFPPSSRD